ncbi:MAG: class I SAM-dependent methyltransferase [Planctomycetota bacterium]|nr:class I SAM-dependent methyltransferase [Planctomycetota bacterium]MDA1178232.1 class I SAM-dependent methyltransferase [Planctomycetota bacterium]
MVDPKSDWLPRTLESEVMASDEEALAYDDMDHATVNSQFIDDLLAVGLAGSAVLDLGTGTARIPIMLCRRSPNVRVMAADLSVGMLDMARRNVEISGLRERIQLDHSDAKQLPYADEMFDVVMSNSMVHHLSDPELALRESLRVLRQGGLVFMRDLLRPRTNADVERLVSTHAQNENEEAKAMLRASLHAALTLPEIQAIVTDICGDGGNVQVTSDRHWTWTTIPRPKNESS